MLDDQGVAAPAPQDGLVEHRGEAVAVHAADRHGGELRALKRQRFDRSTHPYRQRHLPIAIDCLKKGRRVVAIDRKRLLLRLEVRSAASKSASTAEK
jgi:hypothetical protein